MSSNLEELSRAIFSGNKDSMERFIFASIFVHQNKIQTACDKLDSEITMKQWLLLAVVSTFEDELHWNRKVATLVMSVIIVSLGTLSCLGFNVLSNVTPLKMDILSFFDFLTNSVMMPIAAISTVVLVLKKENAEAIEGEIMSTSKFRRKAVYRFVLRYLAIIFLLIILISSVLNAFGIISL